jgi:predicted Zn-dependent peptidase
VRTAPQDVTVLPNGLTLLVEEMPSVRSVSYELRLPGGVIADTDETVGASLLLAELLSRGAAGLSAQELSTEFEHVGISHGESVAQNYFSLQGSALTESLEKGLKLLSMMVMQPDLPEADVADIQSLLLQEIDAVRDNPMRLALQELTKKFYPSPFNRPLAGEEQGIQYKSVHDAAKKLWQSTFVPHGALLSIAGNVKSEQVKQLVADTLGSWSGKKFDMPRFTSFACGEKFHVNQDTAQLQIALAYPAPAYGDPHYYAAKVAAGILSGGMFGRLFIEVREKRGLCYSVAARHSATSTYGTMLLYAGTTAERASETLHVSQEVLSRVAEDISHEELHRVKVNLKASIVIGSESSSSRASTNASDFWHLGQVRSKEEVEKAIEQVSAKDIVNFCEAYPLSQATLLTLGSRDIKEDVTCR